MDYYSLFTSQITDIFRIGLLAGLIYTIERTRSQTGVVIPILAGLVFVAVIIPSTIVRLPVISSNAACRSLWLKPGITLTVLSGYKLDIKGK